MVFGGHSLLSSDFAFVKAFIQGNQNLTFSKL
jgi:hypothetical protein